MNPSWTMHNIKLDAVDNRKPASCKVLMQRDRISWLVKVSAFWPNGFSGDLWLVGDGARHMFEIKSGGGIYMESKKLNAASWDNFIYKAKNIAVVSGGRLYMIGKMPQRKPLNSVGVMSLILSESSDRKIAERMREERQAQAEGPGQEDTKPEKGNPIQPAQEPVRQDPLPAEPRVSPEEEQMLRIKGILSSPIERIQPPVKGFRLSEPEPKAEQKADIIPISWDPAKIEEALTTKPLAMPFAGNYAGSRFVRVDVSDAQGYDHVVVGKVPLEKMPVYMLCVPGLATRPPAALPEFNRWIPGRTGNGYWVKYITS